MHKAKTIDVNAKEWFDRVNGNSYFSAIITVDFGLPTEKKLYLPFQYGYGDHYLSMAAKELGFPVNIPLWKHCRDNDIILRKSKQDKCLKKDVVAFGKPKED